MPDDPHPPNAAGEPLPAIAPVSQDAGADCIVCAEPVLEGASALCNNCAKPFHLILTNDGVGKDCGEVWLNEEFMALEFGCHRCLAQHRGEPADPAAPSPARIKHRAASARDIVRRKRR